ncbi:Uncharacterised protein, partial [Mycoplasma putrefaciens]
MSNFFQKPKIRDIDKVPMIIATINKAIPKALAVFGFLNSSEFSKGKTNIPPCGAGKVILNNPTSNPVINPPDKEETEIRFGSTIINGIAPSLIKNEPISQLVFAASLSFEDQTFLNKIVHNAIPNGGTIPPAIEEAIIFVIIGCEPNSW